MAKNVFACHAIGMSITTEEISPRRIVPKPEVLRQNITDRINGLSNEELVVLNDVIQDIEMRSAWADFSEGMSNDWEAGRYDQLDKAIRDVRAARHP